MSDLDMYRMLELSAQESMKRCQMHINLQLYGLKDTGTFGHCDSLGQMQMLKLVFLHEHNRRMEEVQIGADRKLNNENEVE